MCCSNSFGVLLFVFCFAYLGTFVHAQWVFEDDGCRTPDRGTGNCVPLKDCEPMIKVLQTVKRPVSDTILKKLQAYTCGSSGASVKASDAILKKLSKDGFHYDIGILGESYLTTEALNTGCYLMVCCPSGPIILEPTKVTQNKDDPPDVSSHRNLYLLPKDCGYLNTDNRIVNGEDAALNEFPWMALLRYRGRKGLGFNCGGTIINKNYILTAAHCITALSNSQLVSVRVGEHNIKTDTDCETVNRTRKCNPPVQDVTIEEIIPHPKFGERTFLNDIGLIRVSTMNLEAENARAVCLPLAKERTKNYDAVIVTGWGVTNTNTGETSDILQKVRLPIADKTTCTNTYNNHNIRLTKTQICAGGVQNKDSCPGDSGGPMMVPTINDDSNAIYVQQGIVSFGPKYCGIPGYPGVYTLVNHYMDWILDTLKP